MSASSRVFMSTVPCSSTDGNISGEPSPGLPYASSSFEVEDKIKGYTRNKTRVLSFYNFRSDRHV